MTSDKSFILHIFISRLENLMRKNKISAYRLAKELNISESAISNWRSGNTFPQSKRMEQLAEYFGVDIDYLVGNSGNDNLEYKHYLTKHKEALKCAMEYFINNHSDTSPDNKDILEMMCAYKELINLK